MDDSRAKWAVRDHQRLQNENRVLRRELARAKARIAQLELDALLHEQRDLQDLAWLQGKVIRQKRALNRLNEAREATLIVMEDEAEPSG